MNLDNIILNPSRETESYRKKFNRDVVFANDYLHGRRPKEKDNHHDGLSILEMTRDQLKKYFR